MPASIVFIKRHTVTHGEISTMVTLQIGSRDYANDVVLFKKALSQMETLLSAHNGYVMSEPSYKFGWSFFMVTFKPQLQQGIEDRFADMINKYRWDKPDTKFAKFMQDYLHAKGCKVSVKLD